MRCVGTGDGLQPLSTSCFTTILTRDQRFDGRCNTDRSSPVVRDGYSMASPRHFSFDATTECLATTNRRDPLAVCIAPTSFFPSSPYKEIGSSRTVAMPPPMYFHSIHAQYSTEASASFASLTVTNPRCIHPCARFSLTRPRQQERRTTNNACEHTTADVEYLKSHAAPNLASPYLNSPLAARVFVG